MKNKELLSYLIVIILFSIFSLSAKKIVVTGGAGFIGSHVAQQLLKRGDSVVIIDNLNDAYDVSLKLYNLAQVAAEASNNNVIVYQVDICDAGAMENIFKNEQPDVICHLAARAGVRASIENPYEYYRSNVMGTLVVFEMARKFAIKHIVCASSSSVYGAREKGPFYEHDVIDKQLSPYGVTKHAGELLSYVYHYLFGISVTNLRFFSVYGPRGRTDMAPFIFMDAVFSEKPMTVFGNGSAIRDFTYIDDIVDGIIRSIDIPLGYEILNLGRGEPIILTNFIAAVENTVGKKAIVNYIGGFSTDAPLTHADIAKARTLLGYNPQTSITDGLNIMHEWYKNEYLLVMDGDGMRTKQIVVD